MKRHQDELLDATIEKASVEGSRNDTGGSTDDAAGGTSGTIDGVVDIDSSYTVLGTPIDLAGSTPRTGPAFSALEQIQMELWGALRSIQPYPPTLDRTRGVPKLPHDAQVARYTAAIETIHSLSLAAGADSAGSTGTAATGAYDDYAVVYRYHYWMVVYSMNLLPVDTRDAARAICRTHTMQRLSPVCKTPEELRAMQAAMLWHAPFAVDEYSLMLMRVHVPLPAWYRALYRTAVTFENMRASRPVRHFTRELSFGELRDYIVFTRRTSICQGRRGIFIMELTPSCVSVRYADEYDVLAHTGGALRCTVLFGNGALMRESPYACVLMLWYVTEPPVMTTRRQRIHYASAWVPVTFNYREIETVEARGDKYKGDTPAGAKLTDGQLRAFNASVGTCLKYMATASLANRPHARPRRSGVSVRACSVLDTIIEYHARCDHCGTEVTMKTSGCSYGYFMGRINMAAPYSYANTRLLCWSCGVQAPRYIGEYDRIPCVGGCSH